MSNISVIIPCHNQGKWLKNAVESARQAGCDDIIVVNDASTDDSYEVADELTEHICYFHIDPPRAGVCYSRNMGIDGAMHPLILPLDADDALYPDALERLEAAWQPGTWVYGNYTEVDEDGTLVREVEAPPPGSLYRKNLAYATFLFHVDDWKRAGGYDPDFELAAEDYAFQVALKATGCRPVKLDGAPIYKRTLHANSRTSKAIHYFPLMYGLIRQKWTLPPA